MGEILGGPVELYQRNPGSRIIELLGSVGATAEARTVRSLGRCPGGSGVLQAEAGNPNVFSRMGKAERWEVSGDRLVQGT